ncbi:glycosyltransferase family 2 protein, partial [Clostridium saudiense]|nr:glycosyltransferase family 2 protein [Clostridium saudiense]
MPKISVIVPAYNTEKYIGRCIESILNQSYKELELIIINDGSTDSSAEIIKKYAKKDSRII